MLDPGFLAQVVETLFPERKVNILPKENALPWSKELEITGRELSEAVKRLGAAFKAPDPDGVPGRVWALVLGKVDARLKRLYNKCLQTGTFPSVWKKVPNWYFSAKRGSRQSSLLLTGQSVCWTKSASSLRE